MDVRTVFFVLVYSFLEYTNGQVIQATPPQNLVTQTVYGFLDFTTVIGNTVMIFSPQSSTLSVGTHQSPVLENKVITSKPTEPTLKKFNDIKPSKLEILKENQVSKSIKNTETSIHIVSTSEQQVRNNVTPLPSSSTKALKSSSVINIITTPSILSSKVEVVEATPTKLSSKSVEPNTPSSIVSPLKAISSDEFNSPVDSSVTFGNQIFDAEYDLLSRQPSEAVEETYKVINFKPASSKFILKPKLSSDAKNKVAQKKTNSLHPTGLVTRLGGTIVKDGVTTAHETSVIGTYISGKYAQVLQSTSHIVKQPQRGKISPSPTLRILKTAAPTPHKGSKNRHLEPTPVASINHETAIDPVLVNNIKSTKKAGGQQFKLRYKSKQKESEEEVSSNREPDSEPTYKKKSTRNRTNQRRAHTSHRTSKPSRGNRKSHTTTHSSVHSDDEHTTHPSTGTTKRFQSSNRRNKQHRSSIAEAANTDSTAVLSRRAYKPKLQTSTVDASSSSALYKFKLNRSPGRWQYKTSPRPRVTIRRKNGNSPNEPEYKNETSFLVSTEQHQNDTPSLSSELSTSDSWQREDVDGLEGSESIASIIDDNSSLENKLDTFAPLLETIKVDISTPPDFKDIYYEIATIKSPYTFQVGSVKNTRFITVTSTFEKSLVNTEESTISATSLAPLTENILGTSNNYATDSNFLDSSIVTLPPIYLASDMKTPPLETLTNTFSTTETVLKTYILPVVYNPNDTSTSTLLQTYMITRLVTATKTLPPMEVYQFNPSKTLNEFNSHLDEAGSELHLELEFGDQNDQDEGIAKRVLSPDFDLANIGSNFHLSDIDKSKINEIQSIPKPSNSPPVKSPEIVQSPALSPEQLQQLALLRLLNPAAAGQPQVITTSKPVFKVETLYESHVIPIKNGPITFSTTLSKIIGTTTKTEYEFGTSTIGSPLQPPLPFPQAPVNPLFPPVPQHQPQFSVTSSPILKTTSVTQTTTKVLKLTFGAKTAYTTVLSPIVVPTVLTSYVTASVPVQPTAAFPGFFPAPYPPYPYLG